MYHLYPRNQSYDHVSFLPVSMLFRGISCLRVLTLSQFVYILLLSMFNDICLQIGVRDLNSCLVQKLDIMSISNVFESGRGSEYEVVDSGFGLRSACNRWVVRFVIVFIF